MPLLKRKAFEKSKASEYLRDDDEVFHCEITDEIFKDYEEYCERIILVNSMVWSCEMTGKNNLTYAEALDSEKAARRSLKDFPMELRIPILYLASRTNRSSFAEMSEDVFNYVRERYFVGETVEACLEGDQWREAHVLSVTCPKQQPGSSSTIPASSYCYEVEQFEEESSSGQIGTAPHDRIRRKKGIFSREKCRLFLKLFVEMANGGIICIKQQALQKYNINKVMFDQIFTGSPPVFPSSKKLIKTSLSPAKGSSKPGSATKLKGSAKKATPDNKGKQQSMDKFVKKTVKTEAPAKPKPDPQAKKSAQELADKMRRAEELMRQRKEDEKAQKKEKNARIQAYLKEWQKVKDDLELEDHKALPKGTPIEIEGISQAHIGDFLAVLEFVHLYADTLKTKDVFHNGLDIDTFRKALTMKDHAGVLCDLVQMFLTTIFSLQEDEAEEYNEGGRIDENNEDTNDVTEEMGVTKAIELATKASKWSQTYLGTPLSKLHLDPTTVTEVLRLHLLSSGARAGARCSTWRYQQRGGYSSSDDPALQLRVRRPHLIRALRPNHLHALPTGDKLVILQCLMSQILSYATVRDIIEERLEAYKTTKVELRAVQIQERKREMELVATRAKMKKEATAKKEEGKLTGEAAKTVDAELAKNLEKLAKEGDTKKAQFNKKLQQLHSDCFAHLSLLGTDRAYRRYWINQSVGGIFVEAGDENRGPCLDKPVLPAARDEDTLAYVTKLFEKEREKGSSDKENDSGANSRGNSPKKPLSNLNGLAQKLNVLDTNLQQMKDLLVCTGDTSTCFVHGKTDRPQWVVYSTEEEIDGLIQSLNKRGVRESELRQTLESDRAVIMDYINKCPLHVFNPKNAQPPLVHHSSRHKKFQPSMLVPEDCSVSEAIELSLRDYILELEEKIHHGCLGSLKVKDREAWRGTIMLRGYDKQVPVLTWGSRRQLRDDALINGAANNNDSEQPLPEKKYREPGYYLGGSQGGEQAASPETAASAVRGLASALLQLEQGIQPQYLKRPLGLDDKDRKEREAKGKPLDMDALERWEVSLMESQSFAQILLHLFTLDSSIHWSASILNASCRICRRKTDPDNMLLCDSCNKGHHLYCLKPKLTKVPTGDWFCEQCKPKEERTPRKRRKLFSDDDLEDNDDESEEVVSGTEVCSECGSGGRLAARCQCGARRHRECAPARRNACQACLNPPREVRRCAAEAISNIHQYTRALDDTFNQTDESEDSEDNTALVKLAGRGRKRSSKEPSPQVNGHAHSQSRARKSKDEVNTSRKSRSSKTSTPLTNGVHEPKAKKRSRQPSPALHTDAMHDLLRDVMRHKDSWPFYEPVSLDDVPDYLQIIETPMDFTTIKNKLEQKRYSKDDDVIEDAAIVFRNCYTYNQDTHPVARAGVRLEKYFNRRCTELELPTLPEINMESQQESNPQPQEDLPKAKRSKVILRYNAKNLIKRKRESSSPATRDVEKQSNEEQPRKKLRLAYYV